MDLREASDSRAAYTQLLELLLSPSQHTTEWPQLDPALCVRWGRTWPLPSRTFPLSDGPCAMVSAQGPTPFSSTNRRSQSISPTPNAFPSSSLPDGQSPSTEDIFSACDKSVYTKTNTATCLFPARPLDIVHRTVIAKWMSYADSGSSTFFHPLPTIQVRRGSQLFLQGELAQLNLGHTGL